MRRGPARHTHSPSAPKNLRCAIYTRVSTEHGLDQDFNSLDAQREACSAYIKSQAHEGRRQNRDHYDDGGFSGGSLERPALQRLLEAIESRKVDVIVVYKVDRLTRSLADFAKLVELFDEQGVSFVSVTQSFNTTSSMGRLTLNVLLSFAQFEREVTGERIRDKIAASKKKGIWVGGIIPFGYRLENRKLLVEENEGKIVRLIFERYLALNSIRVLEKELNSAGILTRRRELSTGKVIGGIPFTQGPIAHILKNRTYIGELNHRKNAYPADHAPIVSRELFDDVQKQLEGKRNARAQKHQASGALLIGKLFDQYGRPMTPTYACKGPRRYRYYVSRRGSAENEERKQAISRVRAAELEKQIVAALAEYPALNSVTEQELEQSTCAASDPQMQARHPRSPLVDLSIAPSCARGSARGTSRSPSQAKQLEALVVRASRFSGNKRPAVLAGKFSVKPRQTSIAAQVTSTSRRAPPLCVRSRAAAFGLRPSYPRE
jgi:DNA invertase Pin-like site-specific DNA recombinase